MGGGGSIRINEDYRDGRCPIPRNKVLGNTWMAPYSETDGPHQSSDIYINRDKLNKANVPDNSIHMLCAIDLTGWTEHRRESFQQFMWINGTLQSKHNKHITMSRKTLVNNCPFAHFSTNSFYCINSIVISENMRKKQNNYFPYFVSMEMAAMLDFIALANVQL